MPMKALIALFIAVTVTAQSVKAYEIEADMEIGPDATARLMLFATPELQIGLERTPEGVLRRVSPGMKQYKWAKDIAHAPKRISLRITNHHEEATLSYCDAEGAWQSPAPGYVIDRMGEALSGFRAALFAHGTGFVRIEAFRYRALTS